MLKEKIFNINIERNIRHKTKSKSKNKRTISHNKNPTKKNGFHVFSNMQYNSNEFLSFNKPKSKNKSNSNILLYKRNSKNEINSYRSMNIKNIKHNKLRYLQNKEKIYISNIIRDYNKTNENFILKKKKTKSLDNKKGIVKNTKNNGLNKLIFDLKKNNLLLNKKLSFKNEYLNDKSIF